MSKTVVIYEEEQVARLTAKVLEAEGYSAVLAASGDDVVTCATAHRPWLLLLGEGVFGLENIKPLREKLPDEDTPIIFLISKRSEGMFGYAHGADMYLTKPFNPQELVQFVRRIRASSEQGQNTLATS